MPLLLGSLLLGCAAFAAAASEAAPGFPPAMFSVEDFGARGDNAGDCTAVFFQATTLDAAAASARSGGEWASSSATVKSDDEDSGTRTPPKRPNILFINVE